MFHYKISLDHNTLYKITKKYQNIFKGNYSLKEFIKTKFFIDYLDKNKYK